MVYIPVLRQKKGFCGLACLQSIFYNYGIKYSQQKLARLMNPQTNGVKIQSWIKKQGSDQGDLARLCHKLQFEAFHRFDCTPEELKKYIKDNLHVIVAIFDPQWGDEHYLLAFDYDSNNIFLGDPMIPGTKSLQWPIFHENWKETDLYPRSEPLQKGQVLVVYPRKI